MSAIRSYRDLKVWQHAVRAGLLVYEVTGGFPASERYGLVMQMRRSAISIASNIAEGYGRSTRTEYLRFLKIARGSLYELDTQLEFARALSSFDPTSGGPLLRTMDECGRILNGLIRRIERS